MDKYLGQVGRNLNTARAGTRRSGRKSVLSRFARSSALCVIRSRSTDFAVDLDLQLVHRKVDMSRNVPRSVCAIQHFNGGPQPKQRV
jgi:hypothetical protein